MNYSTPHGISSTSGYGSFGMTLVGRNWSAGNEYRYGFNGKEHDDEIAGKNNAIDFGARIYDTRLGRWLSVDPIFSKFSYSSPYTYAFNNPIFLIDIGGLIPWPVYEEWVNRNGKTVIRYIASFYGPRDGRNHNGLDINLGSGTDDLGSPVLSTHTGKVIAIKQYTDNDGGGNRVYIQSVDGSIQTRYMHLESFATGLEVGKEVKEGQVIGYIGHSASGNQTSSTIKPHLHYEIRQKIDGKWQYVNPVNEDGSLKDPQKMLGLPSEVDASENGDPTYNGFLTDYLTLLVEYTELTATTLEYYYDKFEYSKSIAGWINGESKNTEKYRDKIIGLEVELEKTAIKKIEIKAQLDTTNSNNTNPEE